MEKQERRESVVLENGDLALFCVFHLPTHVKNPPIVVFCHGLAGNKSGKDRIYVELASMLTSVGIASFRFDYRGSGDSQGTFYDMLPEDNFSDTELVLNFIKNNAKVNTNQIGIFARSYGGVVAVKTAAKLGGIKSMVLWCPMFSGTQWQDQWQLLLTNSVEPEQESDMMKINGQQGSKAFFEKFMALNVKDSLMQLSDVPLLHIHGQNDNYVNMQHAVDYEICRESAAAKSKFIRLPHTDHDFSNYEEKQQSLLETVNWFQKTLKTSES